MSSILQLEDVSRSFGGVRAVQGVSFSVNAGQLFGVIGPNGAGKTTLFNLITGLIHADGGRVTLDGVDTTHKSPEQIAVLGIARTYQTIRLFDSMTVRENVMVGGHSGLGYSLFDALAQRRRFRDGERALGERVDRLLQTVGLAHRAADPASALSYGEQRRLELARALAGEPRVLMLDEPAAGMNTREAHELGELLRRLVTDGGLTVGADRTQRAHGDEPVRPHRGDELRTQAHRRRTRRGAQRRRGGRGLSGQGGMSLAGRPEGTPVCLLSVEDVVTAYGEIVALKGVSLQVNEGEVVCLLGANGAGKSTLINTISGILRPRSGRVMFQGRDTVGTKASKIAGMGIAQVPEGAASSRT